MEVSHSNQAKASGSSLAAADSTTRLDRIAPHLALLAESDDPHEERRKAILLFLRETFRGVGIFYSEVQPDRLQHREALWTDKSYSVTLQPATVQMGMQMVKTSRSGSAAVCDLPGLPHLHAYIIPLIHRGRTIAVVGLLKATPGLEERPALLALLQVSLGYLHYSLFRRESNQGLFAIEQSAALIELTAEAASAPHFSEATRILTTRIKEHLGCHQAMLGLVKGSRIRLSAISGIPDFHRRSRGTSLMQTLMRETLLEGGLIKEPSTEVALQASPQLNRAAHREFSQQHGGGVVISLPLLDTDKKTRAILTLLWSPDQPPHPQVERFLRAAEPHLGAIIHLLAKADPGGVRHWRHTFWTQLSRRKKVFMGVLGLGLIALLAWPVSFPVRVNVETEATQRRVIATPFEGILREALVEAGDTVTEGTLLAVLDDQQLRWRHAEIQAALERAQRERDQAIADPRRIAVAAQMAQLEVDRLSLDLELLRHRLNHLEIRAPIEGVVLSGDLSRARGMPLETGQILFELAPLENLEATLHIPAFHISLVSEGASVRMRLASYPGQQWQGTIRRIHPQSVIVDGNLVFAAEATLDSLIPEAELRPGMRGRATIRGPQKPLIWVLSRRLVDFLYLRFG